MGTCYCDIVRCNQDNDCCEDAMQPSGQGKKYCTRPQDAEVPHLQ